MTEQQVRELLAAIAYDHADDPENVKESVGILTAALENAERRGRGQLERWLDWFEREVGVEGDYIHGRDPDTYLEGLASAWKKMCSLCLELQTELRELQQASEAASRARVIGLLTRTQGRTQEQAELIVDALVEGDAELQWEDVTCWTCEGRGFVTVTRCLGVDVQTCGTCDGSRKATRYKLPDAAQAPSDAP